MRSATSSRTMQAGQGIVDLDHLIKEWAVTNASQLNIRNAKKARVQIVWDHVTFLTEEATWLPVKGVPQPPSRTVYSSCFRNNTAETAEHTVKVERTSSAALTTCVNSGYTTERSLSLALSLPYEVGSATASFGRNMTLEKTEENTVEHVQSWSVDTVVPSRPRTLTRVKVKVNEIRWKGKFVLPVIIKGKIIINFYDQNTPGTFLGMIEEEVQNLLCTFGGTPSGKKAVKWTVTGISEFTYGVEQETDVTHEPIA